VYTKAGEPDRAIEVLIRLLSIPSDLTVQGLRANPAWDALRNQPRFQALLKT
jgi:hypothetical protein